MPALLIALVAVVGWLVIVITAIAMCRAAAAADASRDRLAQSERAVGAARQHQSSRAA